jgi:hypothetical protein
MIQEETFDPHTVVTYVRRELTVQVRLAKRLKTTPVPRQDDYFTCLY